MPDPAPPAGPKLRSLEDLNDALNGGAAGRCDRCRRTAATLRLDLRLRRLGAGNASGNGGQRPAAANILASMCEPCAVEVFAVVGRATGHVA